MSNARKALFQFLRQKTCQWFGHKVERVAESELGCLLRCKRCGQAHFVEYIADSEMALRA